MHVSIRDHIIGKMRLTEQIIIIAIVFLLGISYFSIKWVLAEDKLKFSTQETDAIYRASTTK